MNPGKLVVMALAGTAMAASIDTALATKDDRADTARNLVRTVRDATRPFQDVNAAFAAGYASMGTCVSGPEEGAMGIHYPNGALIGDGVLDAMRPEVLMYEQRNGRLRLLGVEFIVLAQQWDAANAGLPMLMGQHLHYVGSPNRYRLPPFYELHVWAWKDNPSGMFVDWNPDVSCEEYAGEADASGSHGSGH
jgi:hypothetical protein